MHGRAVLSRAWGRPLQREGQEDLAGPRAAPLGHRRRFTEGVRGEVPRPGAVSLKAGAGSWLYPPSLLHRSGAGRREEAPVANKSLRRQLYPSSLPGQQVAGGGFPWEAAEGLRGGERRSGGEAPEELQHRPRGGGACARGPSCLWIITAAAFPALTPGWKLHF